MTIFIAIVAISALAILAVATLAKSRNNDIRGIGEANYKQKTSTRKTTAAQQTENAAVKYHKSAQQEKLPPKADIQPWVAPTPEKIGLSRRKFFNRATITLAGIAGIGGLAAGFIGFLWPTKTGGFGSQVNAGKIDAIKNGIQQGGGFFYVPEARSWITEYPKEALPAARTTYPENVLPAMEEGIVVLSQKCPHLGCRIPECSTSQWFECQCHGSQYNRVGEKKAGPAPRGMDHHPATVTGSGDVIVNTATLVTGASIGTNTTGQEAEGPHCTSGDEH
jgi:cytochrome b6-f complex iron-sulfur subunit